MRARQLFLETLLAHHVTTFFGNPGSTENAVVDGLFEYDDLRYILALHEGVAIGAATFYAQASGETPLVKLQSWDTPVPIYGKCEHMNPGGSVKDRLALALVNDGEAAGKLKPGDTIVEATAGNTGMGLALGAAARPLKGRAAHKPTRPAAGSCGVL